MGYIGVQNYKKKLTALAANTGRAQLGIESIWASMTETNNSFHGAHFHDTQKRGLKSSFHQKKKVARSSICCDVKMTKGGDYFKED